MDQQRYRQIPETAYLNLENTPRYRAILSYFYKQHERLRHFLYPEEIFEHLTQSSDLVLEDYNEDRLRQDLTALENFGNLMARQDPSRVTSIREFQHKKFRYQATPYTIEIERMVNRLANLGKLSGGSLQLTLFDRLLETLNTLLAREDQKRQRHYLVFDKPAEELNQLWDDLYGYFQKMGESASDYLAHLKDAHVEEHMKMESFITYKDAFTEYLRKFIIALQKASARVEAILTKADGDFVTTLINRLADYQMSIPRLQEQAPNRDEIVELYRDRWFALVEWFTGTDGRISECQALQNETTEAIRRIARFAQRLGERLYHVQSRRRDYEHLATWFANMDDLDDAHCLSSVVFGVPHPRHLLVEDNGCDDMDALIWEQPATERITEPRVRSYKSRSRPNAGQFRRAEQERMAQAYLAERAREQKLVADLLNRGRFIISDLGHVDPFIRKTILGWVSRCYQNTSRTTKTESGIQLKLETNGSQTALLISDDGSLEMPDVRFTTKDV